MPSFCLSATVKWTPYSSKQFAVRPKTSQSQHIIICFLVDQEKIWFEVTLTISHPVTSEMMIFVIIRQRLVCIRSSNTFSSKPSMFFACFGVALTRLKSFLKAEERSIDRIDICHQFVNTCEFLALA